MSTPVLTAWTNKTMLFLWKSILWALYTLLMCLLSAKAAPNSYTDVAGSAEQDTVGLTDANDEDKERMENLFVLKMMSLMERQMEYELGIFRNGLPSSHLFQGDIKLTAKEAFNMVSRRRRRKKRKIQRDETSYWDLPIHYRFDEGSNYSSKEIAIIKSGMAEFEDQTCISFQQIGPDYRGASIIFKDYQDCFSGVGMNRHAQPQKVSIGRSCMTKGIVAHEIGHMIGFWHEHSRPDRDEKIEVLWENIQLGNLHNFNKTTWEMVTTFDIPYDEGSLMHYNALAFSRDKIKPLETIRAKDELMRFTMGQRNGLSFYDVKLVNKAYCKDTCNGVTLTSSCHNDGYQDPKNCSRCRCPDGLGGDFCDTVALSNGCGGLIVLTENSAETIETPGYPNFFSAHLACNWLIQSPVGTVIAVTFDPQFMKSARCDEDQGLQAPCEDFVEIRHTTNMAVTGARFCCSIEHPATVVTKTNQTMVLFRSINRGDTGIRATLIAVSCGGCRDNQTSPQSPCYVRTPYTCTRTWKEKTSCGDTSCDPEIVRTVEGTCFREDPQCCSGFVLHDHQCVGSTYDITGDDDTAVTTLMSSEDNSVLSESTDGTANDVTSGWSDWSSWTNCTEDCGGCGTQNRTRDCRGTCVGNSTDIRSCNTESCNTGAALQTCEETYTVNSTCLITFSPMEPCTITTTHVVLKTVSANCCCGYQLEDDGICRVT